MGAAVKLRDDYDGSKLRALARQSEDANQTRRLLALALVYDGSRRCDAAEFGGVTQQVIRDWVLRFNAAGPSGLVDRKAPGQTPKLDGAQRQALTARVERGPDPVTDGVVRWRLTDLADWIGEEYAIAVDPTTVGRMLKALDFAKLSARPRHHAQDSQAQEDFKKVSAPRWRRSARPCRQARQ